MDHRLSRVRGEFVREPPCQHEQVVEVFHPAIGRGDGGGSRESADRRGRRLGPPRRHLRRGSCADRPAVHRRAGRRPRAPALAAARRAGAHECSARKRTPVRASPGFPRWRPGATHQRIGDLFAAGVSNASRSTPNRLAVSISAASMFLAVLIYYFGWWIVGDSSRGCRVPVGRGVCTEVLECAEPWPDQVLLGNQADHLIEPMPCPSVDLF